MINLKKFNLLFVLVSVLGLYTACQTPQDVIEDNDSLFEPTLIVTEPTSSLESGLVPLLERSGPRTQTTGSVPHVQINVESVQAVNGELHRRSFALPGVENHPTIVSLPGATGMWLGDGVPVTQPEVIVAGREFAHIHPDGSLHAALPYLASTDIGGWLC